MESQRENRQKDIEAAPEVTITFSKNEDDTLIDTVLGMLLQSFSK